MTEAMRRVRVELGPDAVIISTIEDATDGVQITAAIEPQEQDDVARPWTPTAATGDDISAILDRHGVPRTLADRLLDAAERTEHAGGANALAHAIDALFRFEPLQERAPDRPLLLIGPPGTGKTSVLVKLAARALLNGINARLLTTDTVRTGAVALLEAYGERLGLSVTSVTEPGALAGHLAAAPSDTLTLIDTMGVNPFSSADMDRLCGFAECCETQPVLVMDASRNSDDAAAIAQAFHGIGPRQMIVTGLDIATRFGGILAAAEAGKTAFAEMSQTPQISNGLEPASAGLLAGLFCPEDLDRSARQRIEIGRY